MCCVQKTLHTSIVRCAVCGLLKSNRVVDSFTSLVRLEMLVSFEIATSTVCSAIENNRQMLHALVSVFVVEDSIRRRVISESEHR